jgi:diaminohydroxyphosphoribosylaminopyrimidine deaminase/5-amino-6-(5-phosphoribosylamino)uracil reductase
MVGAVVLSHDEIVGEGYHAEFGGPHAEAVALAAAGDRARGATLLVTVEPCTHAGKQLPCTEGVVAAGVGRVVIGMPDPNPEAQGGAESLRQSGIAVEVGCLREESERLNAGYRAQHERSDRPFVAAKLATSLDHKIADPAGHSRWISGEEARDWVHWFRAGFQAIGVGGRTAQVDNPMLTVRGPVEPRVPPCRVVFTGRRAIGVDSSLVRTASQIPTIVVGDGVGPAEGKALVERGVDVVPAADLAEGLSALRRRGVKSIVIEGGGRLTGSLLAQNLVDRFAWIVSPVWLGDHAVPATRGLEVGSLLEAERWIVAERRALGQDTLLLFDRP